MKTTYKVIGWTTIIFCLLAFVSPAMSVLILKHETIKVQPVKRNSPYKARKNKANKAEFCQDMEPVATFGKSLKDLEFLVGIPKWGRQ